MRMVTACEQERTQRRFERHWLGCEIGGQRQQLAIAEMPGALRRSGTKRMRTRTAAARYARHDVLPAQGEQSAMQREGRLACLALRPGYGGVESGGSVRIGYQRAALGILESREMRELAPAPLTHQFGQILVVIGEEQERRARGELLAHKQQRDIRR